mgnify:CR=1 FL=1
MKLDKDALDKLPDVISKEQLRVVGHMSKRTATYLLESKLLPSTNTGKKTRCYTIKKEDVIKLFEDVELNPDKYMNPEEWTTTEEKKTGIRVLPSDKYDKSKLRTYYNGIFKKYKEDILDVGQISEITEYGRTTITSWIRKEKLRTILTPGKYQIPKSLLMKWLLSSQYNNIEHKSKQHVKALWGV